MSDAGSSASSAASSSTSSIPDLSDTDVRLVVAFSDPDKTAPVFLDLPFAVIDRNVLAHRKYLQFLAAYITGILAGDLVFDLEADPPPPAIAVTGGQWWYWRPHNAEDDPLGYGAVQLEAASVKTEPGSTGSGKRQSMKAQVLLRESVCVFTGFPRWTQVMHIIPHRLTSAWLERVFAHRLWDIQSSHRNPGELGIDHARNGLYVLQTIHAAYDASELAILATPNRVLTSADLIPAAQRNPRCPAAPNMTASTNPRFTLHWLLPELPEGHDIAVSVHNVEANFNDPRPPNAPGLPHRSLVNYAYACRVLKRYGKTLDVFRKRPKKVVLPPPSNPYIRQPTSGSRTPDDRENFVARFNQARDNDLGQTNPPPTNPQQTNPPQNPPQTNAPQNSEEFEHSESDSQLLESPDDSQEEVILPQHPGGYGGFGEDGRISAEEFMTRLYEKSRPEWEDEPLEKGETVLPAEEPEEPSAKIARWREGMPVRKRRRQNPPRVV